LSRNQSLDEAPLTFVAMISRSRPPRDFSQLPMISSVRPCVSRFGGTGYISAASSMVTPRSTAKSIWAWPSASVFCSPQVMVPRQIRLTSSPLRPSARYSIIAP